MSDYISEANRYMYDDYTYLIEKRVTVDGKEFNSSKEAGMYLASIGKTYEDIMKTLNIGAPMAKWYVSQHKKSGKTPSAEKPVTKKTVTKKAKKPVTKKADSPSTDPKVITKDIEDIIKSQGFKVIGTNELEDGTVVINNKHAYVQIETGDRGPRTDHGGGDDGDDWLEDEEIRQISEPYRKKWKARIDKLQQAFDKSPYKMKVDLNYDEKGYVSIVASGEVLDDSNTKKYPYEDLFDEIRKLQSLRLGAEYDGDTKEYNRLDAKIKELLPKFHKEVEKYKGSKQ